jgi:hypothetical protein
MCITCTLFFQLVNAISFWACLVVCTPVVSIISSCNFDHDTMIFLFFQVGRQVIVMNREPFEQSFCFSLGNATRAWTYPLGWAHTLYYMWDSTLQSLHFFNLTHSLPWFVCRSMAGNIICSSFLAYMQIGCLCEFSVDENWLETYVHQLVCCNYVWWNLELGNCVMFKPMCNVLCFGLSMDVCAMDCMWFFVMRVMENMCMEWIY